MIKREEGGVILIEVITVPGVNPQCETFCKTCGDLRLWCRPEPPLACGGCGAPSPLVGEIGGDDLPRARQAWRERAGN